MKKYIYIAILMVASLSCVPANDSKSSDRHFLVSPDGQMEMTFRITGEGTPQYALTYEGRDVILPSDLGFDFRGVLNAQKIV